MNISTILEICKSYSNLGWSCQEQLHTMIDTGDLEGLNPNAVRYNLEFLNNIRFYLEDADVEELDEIIQDFEEKLAQ